MILEGDLGTEQKSLERDGRNLNIKSYFLIFCVRPQKHLRIGKKYEKGKNICVFYVYISIWVYIEHYFDKSIG